MLELVEDTVGRHDTFGIACNRETYEALGVSGHVNCTDNFNRELAAYGYAPRRFWEPVNFFYNTKIGPTGASSRSSPPSRRPATTSSCARSPISSSPRRRARTTSRPTNGGNPTDIMVRVYAA